MYNKNALQHKNNACNKDNERACNNGKTCNKIALKEWKKVQKESLPLSCKFGHAPMFNNASEMVRITKVLGVDKN